VGDPWVLLILRELREHTRRFNELRTAIANISPRTLSARLKFLEEEGIIVRTVIPETPPRVEYSLTRDILTVFEQLPAERVSLHDAFGRVLAHDMHAPHDVPPFRNSAMDGYAVRAADVQHATPDTPVLLPLAGTVAAGHPPTHPLAPGEAMRIMTGAPVPEGADAVVRFEETSDTWPPETRPQGHVAILKPVQPGENIREAGEDVRQGTVVLPAGTRLTPGVSIGDYDFVKHVLAAEGEMHFWQVSIKPGKPLAFGLLRAPNGRAVPLLGLPGNPVAAYVAFEVFARPAIRVSAPKVTACGCRALAFSAHLSGRMLSLSYPRQPPMCLLERGSKSNFWMCPNML